MSRANTAIAAQMGREAELRCDANAGQAPTESRRSIPFKVVFFDELLWRFFISAGLASGLRSLKGHDKPAVLLYPGSQNSLIGSETGHVPAMPMRYRRLIHAPSWGATRHGCLPLGVAPVSIRAPAWGATGPQSAALAGCAASFYPRPRMEGDRLRVFA